MVCHRRQQSMSESFLNKQEYAMRRTNMHHPSSSICSTCKIKIKTLWSKIKKKLEKKVNLEGGSFPCVLSLLGKMDLSDLPLVQDLWNQSLFRSTKTYLQKKVRGTFVLQHVVKISTVRGCVVKLEKPLLMKSTKMGSKPWYHINLKILVIVNQC